MDPFEKPPRSSLSTDAPRCRWSSIPTAASSWCSERRRRVDRSDGPNFPTWQQTQSIAGPWDVTFDAKWGGPEQPVRFDSLTDWTEHSDPGIKYYSGKAVYRTTFKLDHDPAGKPLAIELGQVKDVGIARVRLNGTDLGVVWRPPFRVDVSKAVKPGENELEVMVVNSWRNRLIGDRELPEDKRLTRTNISVTKNWKLEPSGLLGPITLNIDSTR